MYCLYSDSTSTDEHDINHEKPLVGHAVHVFWSISIRSPTLRVSGAAIDGEFSSCTIIIVLG